MDLKKITHRHCELVSILEANASACTILVVVLLKSRCRSNNYIFFTL